MDSPAKGTQSINQFVEPSTDANPTIAVVTVCRNAAATIERAMKSVASQSVQPHEYWVIDGASTDATLDIVNRYGTLLTGVVSEPDDGIADAFNKGIRHCTSDLIVLLNADDWLEPDAISNYLAAWSRLAPTLRESIVLHGDIHVHDGIRTVHQLPRSRHDRTLKPVFCFDMPINHPGAAISRALYERIGGYRTDLQVAMDFEWLLRAHLHGAVFVYLPSLLAHFAVGGISGRKSSLALDEVYRAQRLHRLPSMPITLSFLLKKSVNLIRRNLSFS